MNTNDCYPLVGIMAAKKKNGSLAGNGPLFTQIQTKLISLNGISFVFTPEDAEAETITGYTFSVDQNRWIKDTFPYPHLVYNRVPFRKSENDPAFQSLITRLKEKNIPFFNPGFINKSELYELMENHEILHQFLPHTIRVQQKQDLLVFLIKHTSIYLKPSQSGKGKGIYRLKLTSHKEIILEGVYKQEQFSSFNEFWESWSPLLLDKNYLAQEEIQSAQYEGGRFDFRLIAHGEKDDYILTGVGIRQSQKQQITTHIPSGGRLLPYKLLQSSTHDQFFKEIIPHIGKALSEQFGYFGEFSIDAGVSETGNYYIYEVNSKPMSFDEKQIEEKKLEQLCRLFLQLTKTRN